VSVSSRLRACGILMVKILNKCILSILVYDLLYRQTAQYFHTPQCFHLPVSNVGIVTKFLISSLHRRLFGESERFTKVHWAGCPQVSGGAGPDLLEWVG